MPPKPPRVYVVKEVLVILGKHSIRLYNELFTRSVHLNLRLLPISLGDGEFRALVRLDLVNDIILAVEVDSQPHAILADLLYLYLTVTALDTKMIKNTMLIRRARGGVLVAEIAFGKSELYAPPFSEGIGLPVSHHRRGIACAYPTGAGFILYHSFFSASSSHAMLLK